MDGSRSPSDIDPDQVAFARNCTMRNGPIGPRPPYQLRALTFSDETATPFQTGRFQHGSFYDGNDVPSLISVHGGRIFKTDIRTWTVQEITPAAPYTALTTGNFTIPIAGGTVAVLVDDSSRMFTKFSTITIGGYVLTLVSIDSATQITVRNTIPADAGIVVALGATVSFTGYDKNNPDIPLNWSVRAENYWILQDNSSYPVIFDGSGSRRANQVQKEVPIGNVMAYAAGRIVVALPDRQSYRAGDIVFGSSGSPANGYRDAILRFTENDYLNEGGDLVARVFGAPSNSGPITMMKAVAQGDTALGQGPLLIGTPNAVFTVNLPFDRTTWKNMANALQTVVPIIGPLGQCSGLLVNTDLWYRALDGERSYVFAQRQFNGSWGNTPMSAELTDILGNDTQSLLEHGSAVLFDNRLLTTVSPANNSSGVYHRGLAVMDFNLGSTLRKKASPAWEGVWTGLRFLHVVQGLVDGKERCFAWVLNDASEIEIWEILKAADGKFDQTADGEARINWYFESPSYSFGDLDRFKKLETARFILSHLTGQLDIQVDYRADDSPCWQPWQTLTRCAKKEDCTNPAASCDGPVTYREQPREPVKLRMPADDFDAIARKRYRTGYEFQGRFTMTGYAQMRQLKVYALDETELLSPDEADAT